MGPRLRRMKVYHPRRRRSKSYQIQKQALKDLEHHLKTSVSALLLCVEQGNTQQFESEKLKLKSDYLKHSNEMQKIAQEMGERTTRAVKDFLDSVDTIVHSEAKWIDEDKIRHCYTATQVLEKELLAA